MISLVLAAALSAADAKPAVSVLYFDNKTGDASYDVLRKGLADMMVTDLVAWDGVTVVERERLEAVLSELKLQQSRFIDPSTAVRVGKAVGAKYALTGTLLKLNADLVLEAKLFSMEKQEVVVAARAAGSPDAIFELEQELVGKVTEGISAKLADPGQRRKAKVPDLAALLAYSKALDLTDQGKLEEARAAFEALVKSKPTFTLARDKKEQLLKRLEEASAKRSELITGAAAELAKRVDATLAKEAGFDALGEEDKKTFLAMRAYRSFFLVAALRQHVSKESGYQVILKGHEAPALAGLRAYAENERRLADELDRYGKTKGTPPGMTSFSVPMDQAFKELDDTLQVGADPESALVRFVLEGAVYGSGKRGLLVGPTLGDLDPKEQKWALDVLERRWAKAVADAKSGNPATSSMAAVHAANVAEELSKAYLRQEKVDDAVVALQRFLDAFPDSTQFKRLDERARALLQPDRDRDLEVFEQYSRALSGCEYWDIRKGDAAIERRMLRQGAKAILEGVNKLEKACKGKERARDGVRWLYRDAVGFAERVQDCDTFKDMVSRFLKDGGSYWELCGALKKSADWCPLGAIAPYPERELVWKLPPELLQFGQVHLFLKQEVPGSKWGLSINNDSLMPRDRKIEGDIVWRTCLAPGTYRATAEGSRYPEKHVYELIFDPGPTAKRVELSVKKKRVEPF